MKTKMIAKVIIAEFDIKDAKPPYKILLFHEGWNEVEGFAKALLIRPEWN